MFGRSIDYTVDSMVDLIRMMTLGTGSILFPMSKVEFSFEQSVYRFCLVKLNGGFHPRQQGKFYI